MKSIRIALAAVACAALAATSAGAACQLDMLAEIPITIEGSQAIVQAEIDGKPVKLLLDTGAFTTTLSRGAADSLGLQVKAVDGLKVYGVGGDRDAAVTTVHTLKLGSGSLHDFHVIVLGNAAVAEPGRYVGLLGADPLLNHDLELDIAHKVVRLIRPKGCQGEEVVYWSKTYMAATMAPSLSENEVFLRTSLNGKEMLAELDTGAFRSIVTARAAAVAGVTPRLEGVVPDGSVNGVGARTAKVYSTAFRTFGVGAETIQNAKLELGEIYMRPRQASTESRIASDDITTPDTLLGFDFVRAHRIYISREQKKIYFTYNGGPIFDLRAAQPADPGQESKKP